MKKQFLHLVLLLLLIGLSACSDDGIDINVNDPQHIPWVEDLIDPDLLNAIGVENIYFGHTPPNIDSLSFIVEKLEYDTCIRWHARRTELVSSIRRSSMAARLSKKTFSRARDTLSTGRTSCSSRSASTR